MVDKRTIAFFDSAADRYANLTQTGTPDERLQAFMELLPEGAKVLDLGCGPARASFHMRAAGFQPDPVDASPGMIALANSSHDIGARLLTFDAVDMIDAYDAVWANFSLLHSPRVDLPRILSALNTALRNDGLIHIALKTGTGEKRDSIDRLYTFVAVGELRDLLAAARFGIIAVEEGHEVGCAGTDDPFVAMRARKIG